MAKSSAERGREFRARRKAAIRKPDGAADAVLNVLAERLVAEAETVRAGGLDAASRETVRALAWLPQVHTTDNAADVLDALAAALRTLRRPDETDADAS